MAVLPPNNAIAWAHFRLRGGWPLTMTWTGGGLALLTVLIVSAARLNPASSTRILFGWASGLLVLQGIVLVLFVPGRISTIIRQDITTRMIESHRLMPIPPAHAIAGYVLGAAAQPLVFFAGIFLLGGMTAAACGVDWRTWLFAHGVLLMFAGFVWVVCAYVAFGAKIGMGILFVPLAIPYLSEGGVFSMLPGFTVLLSPVIGQSIFDLRNTGVLSGTYSIAIAAQIALATACYIAAARKYRSSDAIGTDTVLGLCFVLIWTAVSFAGLMAWDDFRPRGFRGVSVSTETQIIASLVVGMLVAMAPIAANAQERIRFRRHQALRDPAPARPPWSMIIALFIASAALCSIPLAVPDATVWMTEATRSPLAVSAGIIALFLAGLYFLCEWSYATFGKAGWAIFTWLLITWGGPLAIGLMRYGLADSHDLQPIGFIATISPPGSLVATWTRGSINPLPGMMAQGGIVLLAAVLWVAWRRRSARMLARR